MSVQVPNLGNKIFGELLRAEFATSRSVDFRAAWTNDDPELWAKLANGLLRVRPRNAWASERNVDFWRSRAEFGYGLYGRRVVQRIVRRSPVDVMHFNTQTAALLSSDLMRRIPAVITMDQTAVQCAFETAEPWRWTHRASIVLERPAIRAAAALVPYSAWTAKTLIEKYGVQPERVNVIPIGVNRSHFAGIDPNRRQDEDGRPLRILFVGGDFVRKGGPLLTKVFLERFAERDVELHLVTAAGNIPVHPKIIVHRDVAAYSDRWKQLYAEADLFALPTRFEAFGMVFAEAMAAGLPVIGTSIAAIPEIVADGETGFLIPRDDPAALADRLEVLLSNRALRLRLGDNGQARVAETFDGAKNIAKLGDVFLRVARDHRRH